MTNYWRTVVCACKRDIHSKTWSWSWCGRQNKHCSNFCCHTSLPLFSQLCQFFFYVNPYSFSVTTITLLISPHRITSTARSQGKWERESRKFSCLGYLANKHQPRQHLSFFISYVACVTPATFAYPLLHILLSQNPIKYVHMMSFTLYINSVIFQLIKKWKLFLLAACYEAQRNIIITISSFEFLLVSFPDDGWDAADVFAPMTVVTYTLRCVQQADIPLIKLLLQQQHILHMTYQFWVVCVMPAQSSQIKQDKKWGYMDCKLQVDEIFLISQKWVESKMLRGYSKGY